MLVVPLKNSTSVTVPSSSDASAVIVIIAGSINGLYLSGDTISTVGAIFPGAIILFVTF